MCLETCYYLFAGDMFHIRTHMLYEAPKGSNHMSFQPGDIFKVTDTLRSGVVGECSYYIHFSNRALQIRGFLFAAIQDIGSSS